MKTSDYSQATFFDEMELPSTPSAAASRVRTFPRLASGLVSKVRDLVSGRSTGELLANFDPNSLSWRTSQACLVSGWEPFSGTFPRSGMMQSGTVFQLQPLAPLTRETGSGLWHTPDAGVFNLNESPESFMLRAERMGKKHGHATFQPPLAVQVKMWPTPTATLGSHAGRVTPAKAREGGTLVEAISARTWFPTPDASPHKYRLQGDSQQSKSLNGIHGGQLNPTWVEWLMGFPLGWTVCELSETPSSRKSPSSSAKPSSKQ